MGLLLVRRWKNTLDKKKFQKIERKKNPFDIVKSVHLISAFGLRKTAQNPIPSKRMSCMNVHQKPTQNPVCMLSSNGEEKRCMEFHDQNLIRKSFWNRIWIKKIYKSEIHMQNPSKNIERKSIRSDNRYGKEKYCQQKNM